MIYYNIFIIALFGLLTIMFILFFNYQKKQKIVHKELKELKEREALHTLVFEKNNTSELIMDLATNTVLECNEYVLKVMNVKKEDFIGKAPPDLSPEFQADGMLSSVKTVKMTKLALQNGSHTFEWLNKGDLHSEVTLTPIEYKGKPALHVTTRLINDKIELQRENKEQAQIITQIQDSIMSTDTQGYIKTWNLASEKIFGYTKEEIINKHISSLYREEDREFNQQYIEQLMQKEVLTIEIYLVPKEKSPLMCECSLSVLKDNQEEIIGLISVTKDITKRKTNEKKLLEQKEELKYLANHDSLTGLANRMYFSNELQKESEKIEEHQKNLALLFIDLDRFKQINDSLGHVVGDILLKEVAKRLQEIVKKQGILARFGGDEFTILIENFNHGKDASILAQKILLKLCEPFYIDNHTLYISSSIGISLYTDNTNEPNKLLMYADTAMYKAKDMGRNNFQFYSSEMTEIALKQIVLAKNIKEALKNEEFVVYYQAQVNAKKNKVIGMEALVRWVHPTLGLISPAEFIPMAEELGVIVELDRWVMKQAMEDVVHWYEMGLNPGVLALNLAMKQLHKKDFINFLQKTIKETKFKSKWLELEVTEGQIMENPEDSIKVLHKISALGIELAIDDFGTGYSSLSYLKRLPVDKLKIDQSFIRSLPNDDEDSAITKAVIALAKSLHLNVLAEGVETFEQRDFLVDNGCDVIQGYFYCHPIPAREMHLFLEK